ncbi:MAG: YdjY domain-containing protein [Pirellulales bacterium]|nr:YdjY domain-containing protein [Pirellulales bacterium]
MIDLRSSVAMLVAALGASTGWAQDPAALEGQPGASAPANAPSQRPDPPGYKRLSPQADVWISGEKKQLWMIGKVVLREGPLELFACLTGTKEHEAIVAVKTEAYIVHAGLLAIGATAGGPVEFVPEYKPPRGTEIEVTVSWTDAATKRRRSARAQEWIRDVQAQAAMKQPFVFAGSGFWEDAERKQRHYLGEDGDLICVANFPSAVLDVPIQSSQANEQLMFDAFTDRIPPEGTEVGIMLAPKRSKTQASAPSKP